MGPRVWQLLSAAAIRYTNQMRRQDQQQVTSGSDSIQRHLTVCESGSVSATVSVAFSDAVPAAAAVDSPCR